MKTYVKIPCLTVCIDNGNNRLEISITTADGGLTFVEM